MTRKQELAEAICKLQTEIENAKGIAYLNAISLLGNRLLDSITGPYWFRILKQGFIVTFINPSYYHLPTLVGLERYKKLKPLYDRQAFLVEEYIKLNGGKI